MKVSLVIPVYNEMGHLKEFCRTIDEVDLGVTKELVFVDDFSTDGSRELLLTYPFESKSLVVLQDKNGGKGSAIRAGIPGASGDIIGIQDADFEYDPRDIAKILKVFEDKDCHVVFGSRFKKNNQQVHRTFHYLGNKFLTLLSNVFSGLYLTDMESCYKFFRRGIIQNIKLDSKKFGFEPEVTAKLARLKINIAEVPITYTPRNYMEGKKITWKDGVAALWHILFYNIFSTNESRFKSSMDQKLIVSGRIWL